MTLLEGFLSSIVRCCRQCIIVCLTQLLLDLIDKSGATECLISWLNGHRWYLKMILWISNTACLQHALWQFVKMLMLKSFHICCCVPRVVISRLRLIHTHDAVVLALEVDWDKFAATFRWRALSPLSRALPSSKLQLSLHLLLGDFTLITMLILQFCKGEHSFTIWDAFGHLRTLLLQTYAVIASWKT